MEFPAKARAMAERTLAGGPAEAFVVPCRHAAAARPIAYPEVGERLRAAEPEMRALLAEIEARAPALEALAGPPPLPRWNQDWFPRADGAAAFALVAARRPARIIEVGSGHSTRFMAAAGAASLLCIDPAPRAALAGLPVEWRAELLAEAHLPLFASLAPGDIAFFDSSHALAPGSDVDLILNRILPALRPGVLVHVHDVTLPDPYPESWAWRGYAEQQGLAPWILAGGLRPLWSSRWAVTRMQAAETGVLARLPLRPGAVETSFWAVKA